MKRGKLLCLLGMCALCAGMPAMTVNAAENESLNVQAETEGDGYEIIENTDTAKTEEASCSVSVETLCPDGFGLNTYVMLQDDEGMSYRVSINSENQYAGRIYLAPGHYTVTEVSVFHDYKQEFPFDVTETEFTLSANENKTLSYKLTDYARIEAEIAEKTGALAEAPIPMPILSDERFYDTGIPGVTIQGMGTLYYTVEHRGTGEGSMEASGYAAGAYTVVVKIVKTGVIGEAVYQISLDGGQTYIGQDIVADTCKIGDAGLTLYFKTEQDTTEFIEGDEYRVTVPETFPVTASKAGSANLIVTGHPLGDHDLIITVLSSGGLGKSRFTVTSTKGSNINITDVIPASGEYMLEDDISLIFSDSDAYEKGLTYTATIRSHDETVNYTPLYILLGLAVSSVAAVLSFLGSKKEKDSEYRIRRYQWRKEEQEYEV